MDPKNAKKSCNIVVQYSTHKKYGNYCIKLKQTCIRNIVGSTVRLAQCEERFSYTSRIQHHNAFYVVV